MSQVDNLELIGVVVERQTYFCPDEAMVEVMNIHHSGTSNGRD